MPDPTEHEQELIDLAGSYITRMSTVSGLYAVNIQGLLALFHHAEQAERLQASQQQEAAPEPPQSKDGAGTLPRSPTWQNAREPIDWASQVSTVHDHPAIPLSEKTKNRIAQGLEKFGPDSSR